MKVQQGNGPGATWGFFLPGWFALPGRVSTSFNSVRPHVINGVLNAVHPAQTVGKPPPGGSRKPATPGLPGPSWGPILTSNWASLHRRVRRFLPRRNAKIPGALAMDMLLRNTVLTNY